MHVAVLLADCAGTLEVSNRIELRGRETENPPAAAGTSAAASLPNPGVDLLDVPTVHLELKQHSWDTTMGYTAFAIIPDLETGQPIPQILQTASIGEVWHDRTIRIGIFESGQYGGENSAYLSSPSSPVTSASLTPGAPAPVTGTPGVQALANPATLHFGSSRTDLTSQVTVSRRWVETNLIEYAVQGGTDAASRAILPVVYGPRAEATVRYSASRIDAAETSVSGAHSDSTSGACFPALINPLPAGSICEPTGDTLQATETWRHHFTRQSEAWLGAGPAVVAARLRPSSAYEDAVYPAVLAGFQYKRSVEHVRTVLRFDAQIAPLVDVRSGIVDDRAQGILTLQVPLRDVNVLGGLSATRSVASLLSQPVSAVRGSVEVEVKLDPELSVGAGVRYAWQEQTGFGAFSSGLAFIQATFHGTDIRF